MHPVLLTIGPVTVYSYGLFLALGFFVSLYFFWRLLKEELLEDDEKILDFAVVVVIFGLLGARTWYIASHSYDFTWDFGKMILFYRYPGFSFWGGLTAAIFGGLFWSKRAKINFYQYADLGVIAATLGLILVQIGHFFAGTNFGQRHPVQLYEAAGFILIFWSLWRLLSWRPNQRKPFSGALFFFFLMFYSPVRFLAEFFRAEHTFWGNLNIAYPFLGILFAISSFVLYTKFKRSAKADLLFLRHWAQDLMSKTREVLDGKIKR